MKDSYNRFIQRNPRLVNIFSIAVSILILKIYAFHKFAELQPVGKLSILCAILALALSITSFVCNLFFEDSLSKFTLSFIGIFSALGFFVGRFLLL
ncbi:hypothetical protein [Paraclostridium bifermentans]|uniref:hypothetical protein n=1 Tax=Paraclostridium bifermentans TaxID=1490 RepID=UPI00359C9F32